MCDAVNNNAWCGWDGGDCCVDTCVPQDGTGLDCPRDALDLFTDDSRCASPVAAGSLVIDGGGQQCDLTYEIEEDESGQEGPPPPGGRRLQNEDEDEEEGGYTAADCAPFWPYFVEVGDDASSVQWHLKFPHVAYRAYADLLQVAVGAATTNASDIPSAYCPDCAVADDGAYVAFPFDVETSRVDWRETSDETGYPMFHEWNRAPGRSRYFAEPNLVLVGPKITTERAVEETCKEGVDLFQGRDVAGTCLRSRDGDDDEASKGPFGVDATFLRTSSIYRATNDVKDFYADDEINAMGYPSPPRRGIRAPRRRRVLTRDAPPQVRLLLVAGRVGRRREEHARRRGVDPRRLSVDIRRAHQPHEV